MIDIRSSRDIVRLYYIFRRNFVVAMAVTAMLIVAGAFFWPPATPPRPACWCEPAART